MFSDVIALICPNCGGPLPQQASSLPAIVCGFCNVALSRVAHEIKKVEGSVGKVPDEDAERARRRQAFHEAVTEGVKAGGDARDVLKAALREVMGLDTEADVVAKVVWGLAADFEEETGIDVRQDGQVIHRLAEAYLQSSKELSETGTCQLNLPFLTADETGPKHMSRELTIAYIQALALDQRASSRPKPPATSAVTGAAVAEQAAAPKKWWWPF